MRRNIMAFTQTPVKLETDLKLAPLINVRWGGGPGISYIYDLEKKKANIILNKAGTWQTGSAAITMHAYEASKINNIIQQVVAKYLEHENKPKLNKIEIEALCKEVITFQIAKQRDAKNASLAKDWIEPMLGLAKIANDVVEAIIDKMKQDNIKPFFCTDAEYKQLYYEYCNKRVYPFCHKHYMPDLKNIDKEGKPMLQPTDIFPVVDYNDEAFKIYENVSKHLANLVIKECVQTRTSNLVWLHDYHLLLVPEFLAEQRARTDVKFGYHFHIPIPDVKLIIPIPKDIQRLFTSAMQCDYLSFNSPSDMQHFKEVVTAMGFDLEKEKVTLQLNPIGAEPVIDLIKDPKGAVKDTIDEITLFRAKSKSPQVIFSVDRIDPIKGLDVRLKAIEDILLNNPKDAANLLFVMVCPDSRPDIEHYQQLNEVFKKKVDELNVLSRQKLGRDIIKLHGGKGLSQIELQTLGQHADVYMVSSNVDGLHLGPLEWMATRVHSDSESKLSLDVILSDGAGVSQYFPKCDAIFQHGKPKELATLLVKKTLEDDQDKQTRSDYLKNKLDGNFIMEKWQLSARSALASSNRHEVKQISKMEKSMQNILDKKEAKNDQFFSRRLFAKPKSKPGKRLHNNPKFKPL
jgi:trehalose 6-phosphate synthase